VEYEVAYDEVFYLSAQGRRSLVCLCSDQQKLVVFDLDNQRVSYACKINLVKYISPGGKAVLLVGFDQASLEILLLSHTNIFKLILT
jgi:predicted polyphosphate/ATP-dependent NAD kinase